ncbi:MAG: MBOAT family protein [Bacteroidia bacterium]|jgi:alginate O-acetyltransferase complex protein AlgI|nr:MBOAT family protein [Bacteroidia bacterium]
MEFDRPLFLTVFLPLFLLLYGLAARRYKNALLLLASLVFYSWGEPLFVFVLIATTFFDFLLVHLMAKQQGIRRKLVLAVSLAMNLSLLGWFKYRVFFASLFGLSVPGQTSELVLLALPLGISFYTFESITYLVDVYRREQEPLKRFGDYLLYIMLFPKLLAGPIIRYGEIAEQLHNRFEDETLQNWLTGFYRICIGLAKKVLIANQLALYFNDYAVKYLDPSALGAGAAWLAMAGCLMQMYFDFSGYCDIALGIGRMCGFRFPENFNNPFLSPGITEYWRNWHITLGKWMRNYLYIPLGGNKKGNLITYRNLIIVFVVSGLWHGAGINFLLWGCYFGVFIILERLIRFRFPYIVGVLYTFAVAVFSMSLFCFTDMDKLLGMQKALWGLNTFAVSHEPYPQFWLPFALAIFFSFFAATPFTRKIQEIVFEGKLTANGHIAMTVLSAMLFVLSLSFSTSMGAVSFLYLRF